MAENEQSIFDPETFFRDEPRFPDASDQMFTSIFDWRANACVNWCRDGWNLYAAGYKKAGDVLVAQIETDGHSQDLLVYPVLFLYRQFIELELKDLLRAGAALHEVDQPAWQHHRLDDLWSRCLKLVEATSPDDSLLELTQTGRLIGEFARVDPTSFAFRYPEDKSGGPSLAGLRHINLANVRDVVGKIALMLSCARASIDQQLEWKGEMIWQASHSSP
jgi:hypothetical protein